MDPSAREETPAHATPVELGLSMPTVLSPTTNFTSTMAAIVGGGSGVIHPGAVSLAHKRILFLDEAPEYHRDVLDALRQPLESGEVVIAWSGMQAVFTARFTLVLAASPCPCAKTAGPGKAGCSCSPAARRRYLAGLSGPLLDRVDVKVRLQPVSRSDMLYDRKFAELPAVVAQRVAAARERARRAWPGPMAGERRGPGYRSAPQVPAALGGAAITGPGHGTWSDLGPGRGLPLAGTGKSSGRPVTSKARARRWTTSSSPTVTCGG